MEQQRQACRGRKLRRPAEPSVLGIEVFRKLSDGRIEFRFTDRSRGGGMSAILQPGRQRGRLRQHPRLVLLPIVRNLLQEGRKPRSAPAILRGEICAGKEWFLIRSEKYRHRPTALIAIERQGGLHVNLVKIRPFFPIDLDADEMLIHQLGDGFIFKRFSLHHMAPVTGGITNGQENRTFEQRRLRERLRPPGIPVNRVVRMLEKIRTGLMNEAIRPALPRLYLSCANRSTRRANGSMKQDGAATKGRIRDKIASRRPPDSRANLKTTKQRRPQRAPADSSCASLSTSTAVIKF